MRTNWARGFALLLIDASTSGCALFVAGAIAGAGTAIFINGRLEEELIYPVQEVATATRLALEDMGLPILENEVDVQTAKIRSEYADGKKVWIDIKKQTDQSSHISVRVSTLGDRTRSADILNRIMQKL